MSTALAHYVKVILGMEKPYTQTTDQERAAIKKYASRALVAVEIGVFEGVNTAFIAECLPEGGILYGIDPFFKGRLGISYYRKIAEQNLRRHKVTKKVKLIPEFSHEAVKRVKNNIDFIFVDGDHSYEGVKRDWEEWSRKLNPGGIIALHDTSISEHVAGVHLQGSYRFFNETIIHDPRFDRLETVDSLNIMQLKPMAYS